MKMSTCIPLSLLCALTLLAGVLPVTAQSGAKFEVAGISFTPPKGWETSPTTSQMRKAQLKVKDAAGKESADVVFYFFGAGQAGSVDANVDRWFGKFSEPREKINAKRETVTIGKTKVTYVQAEGTYDASMPGTAPQPVPNVGLVGAIVEGTQGNIFIRLTAPKALATASLSDFKKLVESGLK